MNMTSTNCIEDTEPLLPRTKYMKHTLHLTLEEMYKGTTRHMAVNINVLCDVCQGSGSKSEIAVDYIPCEECYGLGVRIVTKRIKPGVEEEMERVCELCWGTGEAIVPEDRCRKCRGRKTVGDKSILKVPVKRGARHGQKIIYEGAGTQEPKKRPGHIVVILEEADHKTFKRQGDDLIVTVSLNLVESLCGFERMVTTIDKRQLCISSPRGDVIQNDELKCIFGEGMPKYKNPSERGNLIIKFEIKYPTSIRSRYAPSIEECFPPRETFDIPVNAVECNLSYIDPDEVPDENHSYEPNDEYYNEDENYYQYADQQGQYYQYQYSNEQHDQQGQYYQEGQGNYQHVSEHAQQYHHNQQGYDSQNNSQQDQVDQKEDDCESLESYDATKQYSSNEQHDQQGQYYQEGQGNYQHVSEHAQQYHHNQQGYDSKNNYHQDQVDQKEDDCASLESYDATKQYSSNEQCDQQGQYSQDVQGNYQHTTEHAQQYHRNQQGYDSQNNSQQDQVYYIEDDCESLESCDATKQ